MWKKGKYNFCIELDFENRVLPSPLRKALAEVQESAQQQKSKVKEKKIAEQQHLRMSRSTRTLTHQASFYEPRAILVVAIIVLSVVNIAEASWGSSERKEFISRTTLAGQKSKIYTE